MVEKKVLIVDDEEQLRKLLSRILTLEGYEVREARSLSDARQLLRKEEIDVICCDVRLEDGNGVEFVKELRLSYPLSETILLTAYGNIPDGIQAIRNGAFDYITKGDDNDRIIPLLAQAMTRVKEKRNAAIRVERDESSQYSWDRIVGHSTALLQAKKLAQRAAATDATILLLGETGTGKEVFANAIHHGSNRAKQSFVAVNCTAFPRDLLEGELFGHKAGAFTGATRDKKGLLEVANKGTILLDEIGDMPMDMQAKLLRVLENGEFIKLGDTKPTRVDVRIIAATHRDLKERVAQGLFREDLYYRLNIVTIELPALRDRAGDIELLAAEILSSQALRSGQKPLKISPAAMRLLQQHQWKGNIRELKNILERACILADDNTIEPEHLPFEIQNSTKSNDLSLSAVENQHIRKVLAVTAGNKTRTAEILGIGLTTLYRKMEEYGIEK
ncbi:MAG: sigma-54-dependent transcriptional regulator [Chitinophagaceae bacterium]